MQFRQHRLANGLEIIAECNPGAYSTALAFFVKTGSRDETEELSGVSHFLEHMVFKGTPRRSAADVNRELDEIGSHSNAFTSEEQTVYYATVLPEYQAQALDLLAISCGRRCGRRFRDGKAGDSGRDRQVRRSAAIRCDGQVHGRALSPASARTQCARNDRQRRSPHARADARLFCRTLQPGKHGVGRQREYRFRSARGGRTTKLWRLGAV